MGQKLVRRKGLTCALAWMTAAACAPRNVPARGGPSEPQVAATVLTIETRLQPQDKIFRHSIVIAGGRARSEDEADRWRLFDLERNQVTFVDDVDRTFRTELADPLIVQRLAATEGPLPDGVPRAEVVYTGAKRVINGVEATQMLIRAGGYQRELWIGSPASVPANLFALMFGTRPAESKYEPMMRDADQALLGMQGFPLADHAELSYGDEKLVVDRNVVKIEQRNVPRSLLNVRAGYRELTEPAASPPPASSLPRGRSTPGAEWRSSATDQKNP